MDSTCVGVQIIMSYCRNDVLIVCLFISLGNICVLTWFGTTFELRLLLKITVKTKL